MTTPTLADSQAAFVVSYEGPAVDDGAMAVRDLAPALLALGQAFDRANTLLNGNRASMSLEIRAAQQGSFAIDLVLKQLVDGAVSTFSGDFVSSAANIKELFFGGGAVAAGGGIFTVLKRLGGKTPKVEPAEAPSAIVLTVDNLRLVIPAELGRLIVDGPIREQLEAVVRPVERNGIERVVFREDGLELESVAKDDAPSFRGDELHYDDTTEIVIPRQRLQPASVNLQRRGGKWRLTDGETTRWYLIRDEAFMQQVLDGKRRFGALDYLVCEVVMRQSVSGDGALKTEYEVTRVLSQVTPGQQASLLDTHP